MSHEEDRYNQHLATKKELTGKMWPDDEPEEEGAMGEEERSNIELLLQLLQRPQYVYKMARPMCDHSKEWQRNAARKRRDNALKEIGRILNAYYMNSLWIIAEEERMAFFAKMKEREMKRGKKPKV